jgi:hypothetical protein
MPTTTPQRYLHTNTSHLSHIMAPRDKNASGSVAIFALCGVVTWESTALITSEPNTTVCSLCLARTTSNNTN